MFSKDTRILICDDMPTIRDMVGTELRRLGYNKIVQADDGAKAWNYWQQLLQQEPVGLIISDWNMPNLSGYDFLVRVRMHPQGTNLPFILLTSEGQKEHILDAISAGVSQYILKPFSAKQFEEKIKLAWQKANGQKVA